MKKGHVSLLSLFLFLSVSSFFAFSAQKSKIIFLEPCEEALSISRDVLEDLRRVAIQKPQKIGAEELELLKYDVTIGKYKNSYYPFYELRGQIEKNPSDIEKHFTHSQSVGSIFTQALIYDLKLEDNPHSKIVLLFIKKENKVVVQGFLNDLKNKAFESEYSLDFNKRDLHESLVRHVIRLVGNKKTAQDTTFSNFKNAKHANIVRVFKIDLSHNEGMPEAYYSFKTHEENILKVEGNPLIPSFITQVGSSNKVLVLDRIVFGSIESVQAYLKENLQRDYNIVKNEADLKTHLEHHFKNDQKKLQFLKQDLENAIIIADHGSFVQAADSILEYFGDRLSWGLMPSNLQSKEDLIHQLKDVVETAKKLYIPDIILLSAVKSLINSNNPHSPFSPNGYTHISKTPEHYVIMKKNIDIGTLIGEPFSSLLPQPTSHLNVELYYGNINNKVVQWLKIQGEAI